jgi:excisionase family DNA binding protein
MPQLTLKQAARQAGCSDSTLRRLVKAGEIPFTQEDTKTGFRYMFDADLVSVIAHKAAMRRPSGRPSSGRVEGDALQASRAQAIPEASIARDELAALRAERDLLKAENARLWNQVERLTESVTRLALPPSRRAEGEGLEAPRGGRESAARSFWDWFFGR